MTKFEKWAADNYKIGAPIDEMWHPEIQAACERMNAEDKARREAERKRIREVVEQTADINAELAGRIVVKVSFSGSLQETKKLTKEEKAIVMKSKTEIAKEEEGETDKLDMAVVGGDKRLFKSEEYDDLKRFIDERRDEFARFGIPHVKFQSAHVVDITRIPEIDALAEKTERELPELVEKLIAVYPSQITPEATKLGPLHNPRDYKPVESLRTLFKFDYDWMAFGVPDELKQFDMRIYAKAKEKAEKAWREIEANGVNLLRSAIASLVDGLIDTLTPKDDGTKKKFYASSVTKITDFIADFRTRNICKDTELDDQLARMEEIVSGLDLKAMSSDMELRDNVRSKVEKVKGGFDQLVVDSEARVMNLRD